jgi:beta-xylosidase
MPVTGSPPTHDWLQASDDFTRPTLGLQWSWNHNPDDAAWSLTARPGYLRLNALPAQHLVTARDTLTQILQGPGSRITARIDITHMADGERGGLSLFGVRPSWIGVVRTGATSRITLASAGDEQPGPVVTGPAVLLRAIVAPDQTVRYSYSLDDGRSYRAIGGAIALARFSWWKGSRPALFTYNVLGKGGSIDVDWFQVDHPWPAPAGGD